MRVRSCLIAAVVAVLPTFAHADAESPKATPFVAALMDNFAAWDADHDGALSRPEIDHAAADPRITGDAAAAAASLKQLSRSKGEALPKLDRAYFEQYSREIAASGQHESARDAVNATVDPGTSAASIAANNKGPALNWDRYFLAGKARIAAGGDGPIWGSRFDPASMRQGPIGDCFFVAVTGSLALRDPSRLNSLVQPVDGDGKTFRASFPNAEPFTFAAPTQAMLALSGSTYDNGAWLAVLEQAYGKQRSRLTGGSLDVDGTEVLRRGGDSMPTIQAITGHKARRISFARTLEGRAAEAHTKLPELRAALTDAIANHRVIVCGILPASPTTRPVNTAANAPGTGDSGPATRPGEETRGTLPTYPKAIVKKHVYAVVSYDAATDTLELWNPHRNNFTPTGEPGLVNGYKTEQGRFKLPLSEAYQFYTSFTFETDQPAPTARTQQ